MSELDKRISERFLEYQYLRNGGAYRSAITRLGEIHQCLAKLSKSERAKWTQRIEQEPISDELIQETKEAMEEDVQRLRRILSHGTRWNAEEVMLVLTLRIELELALIFFNEHLHSQVELPTDDIDDLIEAIAKTSEHQRLFASSRDLIVKNWGLPINSKWLHGRQIASRRNKENQNLKKN